MARTPSPKSPVKPKNVVPKAPVKRASGARKSRPLKTATPPSRLFQVLKLTLELVFLSIAGLVGTISVLGRAANWFGGTDMTQSLLPFAGTVLILAIGSSLMIGGWLRIRGYLTGTLESGRLIGAFLILLTASIFASRPAFQTDLINLKMLVGGTEAAGNANIAHQVYANYRRSDLVQLQVILDRTQTYATLIHQAAVRNDVDEDLLIGVGAAESSFLPRDSKDGGHGLFQITAAPKVAIEVVKTELGIERPDPTNDTHNIYLAAATLRFYMKEMKNDLFLGLLAYNIGPKNGGLISIMNQYGAKDFFTIQPYLKDLPRDYPIRVLTAALAHRLWKKDGFLPRYEEGQNARFIQEVGIPGLEHGRLVP
jgi:hypothetical protein